MAIASVGARGTGVSSASGTTVAVAASANIVVGDIAVITISWRETGATISSVTDASGNVWRFLKRFDNATNGNAHVEVWCAKITTQINSAANITVTFDISIVDKCAAVWEYSVAAGKTLDHDQTPVTNEVNGANGFGSVSFSGLSSVSRLYIRALAKQANSTTTITASTNYTTWALNIRSRNNASAITLRGEHRIVTGTGSGASNPTMAVSGNTAGILLALTEVDEYASLDPTTLNFGGLGFDFPGTTWPGTSSAGTSGSVTMGATGSSPPATGTTLNGHACADFNGSKNLNSASVIDGGTGTGEDLGDFVTATAGSGFAVVEWPSLTSDPGAGLRFPPGVPAIAEDNGVTAYYVTGHTGGMTFGCSDSGAAYEVTTGAISTSTKYCVQWKHDNEWLWIRLNNGGWFRSAGKFDASWLSAFLRMGAGATVKIWAWGLSPVALKHTEFNGVGVYLQSYFATSLGFPPTSVDVTPAIATATWSTVQPTISVTKAPAVSTATTSTVAPALSVTKAPAIATATCSTIAPALSTALVPPIATGTLSTPAPDLVVTSVPSIATASWSTLTPVVSPIPSPGTATCATVAPGLVASVTVSPATASWSSVAPGLEAAVSPAIATATWSTVQPTISVSVSVTPATTSTETIDPALGVTSVPSVSTVTTSTVAPSLSSTTSPAIATASGSTIAPSLAVTSAPSPATATTSTVAPGLEGTVTPDTAEATWETVEPDIAIGGEPVNVSPAIATATWTTVQPTISVGVTPMIASASAVVVTPALVVAVVVEPATATWTTPVPTIGDAAEGIVFEVALDAGPTLSVELTELSLSARLDDEVFGEIELDEGVTFVVGLAGGVELAAELVT